MNKSSETYAKRVRAAVDHLAWTRSNLLIRQIACDERRTRWLAEGEAIERRAEQIERESQRIENAMSLLVAPSGGYDHFDLNLVIDQMVLALKPDLDDRNVRVDVGLPRPLAVYDELGRSARLILEALYWSLQSSRPAARIRVRALVLPERVLLGFGGGEPWPDADPTDGAPRYRPVLEFGRSAADEMGPVAIGDAAVSEALVASRFMNDANTDGT